MTLPALIKRKKEPKDGRLRSASHRTWVRKHQCCRAGCTNTSIECAHVRLGTDGALGQRPSDVWCISLCRHHHAEQHSLGEASFARAYSLDLLALAEEFARKSPVPEIRANAGVKT